MPETPVRLEVIAREADAIVLPQNYGSESSGLTYELQRLGIGITGVCTISDGGLEPEARKIIGSTFIVLDRRLPEAQQRAVSEYLRSHHPGSYMCVINGGPVAARITTFEDHSPLPEGSPEIHTH